MALDPQPGLVSLKLSAHDLHVGERYDRCGASSIWRKGNQLCEGQIQLQVFVCLFVVTAKE